jgi:two-component system, NarL family, invasion response regulator UvrY
MIRIFVADTHPLVRKMLRETLEREADMRVTGEAESTEQVMEGVKNVRPDIIITSLSLSGRGSLGMIGDIKELYPQLPVLVLTMHPEELFAVQTLKSGASGYLTKDMPPAEILKAVRTLVSGGKYIPSSLAEKLAAETGDEIRKRPHDSLTTREFHVLCALVSGKEVAVIAEELSMSVQAVNTCRASIMKKMRMNSMPELTLYAVENRLIEG